VATSDEGAEHEGVAASVKQLAEDLGLLVRNDLELARKEMAEKAKSIGAGAGLLSGSAITGMLTLGALTALLIIAISMALPTWIAALIVTALWAAITAALALVGKKKVQSAGPLVPEQTIQHVKEDVQWAQSGLKSPLE